jgi:hypothetical protein
LQPGKQRQQLQERLILEQPSLLSNTARKTVASSCLLLCFFKTLQVFFIGLILTSILDSNFDSRFFSSILTPILLKNLHYYDFPHFFYKIWPCDMLRVEVDGIDLNRSSFNDSGVLAGWPTPVDPHVRQGGLLRAPGCRVRLSRGLFPARRGDPSLHAGGTPCGGCH